ncbi:hypothetical protein Lal_00013492 [Lupinus albus]|nr:hypothetical protein Lal_00013492 [Lupinus albus]
MEEIDKEILDTFRKVKVNIPLFDAIKQIPRYAMFLKELCTHKENQSSENSPSYDELYNALLSYMKSSRNLLELM